MHSHRAAVRLVPGERPPLEPLIYLLCGRRPTWACAAPKKAQEGEGSEFLGAQPGLETHFFSSTIAITAVKPSDYTEAGNRSA
jgi:hypothetical protein